MKQITEEKINRYLDITDQAIKKVRIIAPPKSHLIKVAEDFLDMASRYYHDSIHFFQNDDYVNALSAVNYAHGWLDAGARFGLFDVDEDDRLFTLNE